MTDPELGDEGPDVRTPALLRALAASPVDLARLILELHRRVVDADSLLDLMARASREAVRMITDAEWAGVTTNLNDRPFTTAHTDERVLVVDEGQYASGDGPCLTAARIDQTVAVTVEQIRARWPAVAAIADAVGVASFHAEPVHAGADAVGSLNLYSARTEGLRVPDPDILIVLVEYLERGLAAYLAVDPDAGQLHHLRQAVTRRHLVGTATGALMARHGVTAEQAQGILQSEATRRRVAISEVAQEIIGQRPDIASPPGPEQL